MTAEEHVVVRCGHAHKWRVRDFVLGGQGCTCSVAVNARDCVVFAAREGVGSAIVRQFMADGIARRFVHSVSLTSVVARSEAELMAAVVATYDALANGSVVKLVVHGDERGNLKHELLERIPSRVALAPRDHSHVLAVEAVAKPTLAYFVGACAKEDEYIRSSDVRPIASRAYWKLAEAARTWQLRLGPRVVDVGASPGGWSQYCLDAGCELVVAVDSADLEPSLAAVPVDEEIRPPKRGLVHVRRRIEDATAMLAAFGCDFDACVCDANCHPRLALRALRASLLPLLRLGAVLVLTLKQPNADNKACDMVKLRQAAIDKSGDDDDDETQPPCADILADLRALGFAEVQVAWFWANSRKERTLCATFRPAASFGAS